MQLFAPKKTCAVLNHSRAMAGSYPSLFMSRKTNRRSKVVRDVSIMVLA